MIELGELSNALILIYLSLSCATYTLMNDRLNGSVLIGQQRKSCSLDFFVASYIAELTLDLDYCKRLFSAGLGWAIKSLNYQKAVLNENANSIYHHEPVLYGHLKE